MLGWSPRAPCSRAPPAPRRSLRASLRARSAALSSTSPRARPARGRVSSARRPARGRGRRRTAPGASSRASASCRERCWPGATGSWACWVAAGWARSTAPTTCGSSSRSRSSSCRTGSTATASGSRASTARCGWRARSRTRPSAASTTWPRPTLISSSRWSSSTARTWPRCCGGSGGCRPTRRSRSRASCAPGSPPRTRRACCTATSSPRT